MRYVALMLLVLGCGRDIVTPTPGPCADGTALRDGVCAPLITCGAGTHLEGAQCFTDTGGLRCGTGTTEQAGVCVGLLTCGPGTTQQGSQCLATGGTTCGAGTMLVGSECVASTSQVTCGAGTMLQGSTCVATGVPTGGWYEVRIGATQIPADGYSKVPVLALGRLPSGLPATDAVVLALDRSTAGSIQMPGLTLGELGSITYFTACTSANNPLCAGPARIQMRLSSSPTQVVAESQDFTLVAPMGVGTTAPCDPYTNALFFDGAGYIFTGTQLVSTGTFGANSTGALPTHIALNIDPALSTQGLWWNADFAAPAGAGPLLEQVYPMAERYPFQSPGNAGLSVSGDGRGCNRSNGRFQIHQLVVTNGQLTNFRATFEQFCEMVPSNVLRGCIKYTR